MPAVTPDRLGGAVFCRIQSDARCDQSGFLWSTWSSHSISTASLCLGSVLWALLVIGLFVAGHALGIPVAGVLEKGLMLLFIGISIAWLYSALLRYYGCGVVSALLRALVLGICIRH